MNYFKILVFSLVLISCSNNISENAKYVNPFIGTGAHGHTFPGATSPFGMVQLSPDTRIEGWDGCSGYHYSDSVIFGFSHTHLSGTGIGDYCDLLLMPTMGEKCFNNGYKNNNEKNYSSKFSKEKETASIRFLILPKTQLSFWIWNTEIFYWIGILKFLILVKYQEKEFQNPGQTSNIFISIWCSQRNLILPIIKRTQQNYF